MRRIILSTIAALAFATSAYPQTNSERVEKFVTDLPRTEWGGAMYWLEMKSIIGWEKMMLIVGYASNGPVCERLAFIAHADSPGREFRCSTAN